MILFVNQLFGVPAEFRSNSSFGMLTNLGAIGMFQYMAWYAVFRLIASSASNAAIRWQDFMVAATLLPLIFLPAQGIIWVSATGIAVYLGIFGGDDAKLRAAGIVLGGLSMQAFWGPIIFNLLALLLLRAETAAVGMILTAVRPGTVWQDNIITGPDGYGILVYRGCSSFHNLSLAMLCWLTISRMRYQNWRARDLMTGAAVAGAMILLNLVRLCLMAWNIRLYHYLHVGRGETYSRQVRRSQCC